MTDRFYQVSTKTTPAKHRLIKAAKNQVEAKLTAETWTIEPAGAITTAELMAGGVTAGSAKGE